MTQTAHIAYSLLGGETLSIMNGFKKFACTNLPREISRSIERKFNVTVSRKKVTHTTVYGRKGIYFEYHLEHTPENLEGILHMRAYIFTSTWNQSHD